MKLRIATKLAFGSGSIAEAGVYIGFTSFNLLFYNNVLGLSGTLCGLAVSIALVFDAISDPLVGALSDRLRSALGRRHPFMYAAAVPIGLCFFAIYAPPRALDEIGLFLWLTVFTILLRTAVTFYSVPHLALGAELSQDYRERSVVMGYHVVFQVVGGATAGFLGWTWFGRAPGGVTEYANFAALGLGIALVASLAVFVSAYFTRDRIPGLAKPPLGLPPFTARSFASEVADCLRNDNYRALLLGLLLLSAMIGVRETLASYLYLFFWELSERSIRIFHLASPPAFILAFLVTPRLHSRIDKRSTMVAAIVCTSVAAVVPIALRMLGWFPPNGSPALLPLLALFVAGFFFGTASLTISVMSALADVADQHELKSGRRQEGIFYSARTFFQKVSIGVGHLLAGLALDLMRFPPGAKPGDVGESQIFALGLVDGPLAVLPALGAIYFYSRYGIDKKILSGVQAELAARREAVAEPQRS